VAETKTRNKEQQERTGEQERGIERTGGGTPARRGDWTQDLFTMNPFAMMRRLSEEMDRAFGSSTGLWRGAGEEFGFFAPPIEVREEEGNLVVSADLPGLRKEDLRVACTSQGLYIEGERKREHEESRGGFRRSERYYGRFQRTIPLPEGADVDKAKAQFKDGVLEVRVPLPKQEQRKAREIPIQT
jgi:HSP20 family protein